MGTRSKHNHVKSLTARKADREGEMFDVLVDALFRIYLDARRHRRGETQLDSAVSVLRSVPEFTGVVSSRIKTLMADRGYEKPSFIDVIKAAGMSSIFIVPNDLVSTHSFAGESHMYTARDDLLEGEVGYGGNGTVHAAAHAVHGNGEDGDELFDSREAACIWTGMPSGDMNGGGYPENTRFTQCIVPESGSLAMSFLTTKRRCATPPKTQSRACAVRRPHEDPS